MKKAGIFVVIIILAAFVTTAQSEVRAGSFSVTPFIGSYVFEGNEYYRGWEDKKHGINTLDDADTFGLRAGYNFTENLGLEGFFSYIPTGRNHGKCDKCDDIDLYYYGIEGIYNFMPQNRFVPFLAIGLGGINYNPPTDEPDGNKFTVDYGAGLKIFVTDNIALRVDVRHVLPLNERYNDLLYTFGINFAFGGEEKVVEAKVEEPLPPPTPPPAPKTVIIEKGRQTLDVKFDFDKATIKKGHYKNIDDLAGVMKDYSDLNVVIEGHTDSVGTDAYNKKLSRKRADAVKKYMVERGGIDANRISAVGYGEERPIASNDTDEGRLRNRRVEAVVDYIIKK
jgi:OmpA-OmpF porin, OOP family